MLIVTNNLNFESLRILSIEIFFEIETLLLTVHD